MRSNNHSVSSFNEILEFKAEPSIETKNRPRVLFVTYQKPWPANYGAAIRGMAQLIALEAFADVDIVILGSLGKLRNDPFYATRRIISEIPWSSGIHLWPLRHWACKLPQGGYWLSTYVPWFPILLRGPRQIRSRFLSIISQGYDVVYLVRPETFWYLSPKGVRPVVDIDDVQSLHAEDALQKCKGFIRCLASRVRWANLKRNERTLFKRCHLGIVCSTNDAKRLGYPNIRVLPNPIPDHGQRNRPISAGNSTTIIFVGALKYKPNIQAVRFFGTEVLPKIRQKVPDATLSVIGTYVDFDKAIGIDIPGVNLLGFVEDISNILDSSSIVVAPLLEGLGTRLKILEALSFGKPVVATHTGAYGISLGPEEGLFREDDPTEIASICIHLMADPDKRRKLGENGKRRVYEIYGSEAFLGRIRDILEYAVKA